MKAKTFFSIAAGKISRNLLRLLKRGGTTFPGSVALKIDREVLRTVSKGVTTIVVAGTNGKTTTAMMLTKALEEEGFNVLSNKSGANMFAGICTEYLMNATLSGKPKKTVAVMECDEASLKYVVPRVHPKVVLVTNIFRDQLDRYGEVLKTLEIVRDPLVKSDAVLVLNGDDNLVASIGEGRKAFYYGSYVSLEKAKGDVNDTPRCLKCGGEMHYNGQTFGHLGDFYCQSCGYKRPALDVGLTSYKPCKGGSLLGIREGESEKEIFSALPAFYNAYNALGVLATFKALSLHEDGAVKALKGTGSAFGRMEVFKNGAQNITMILVKNPAGANEALRYVSELENVSLALLLNDKDQDGTDVSWIWDTAYERFTDRHKEAQIMVAGDRRFDMALRLKYGGAENIAVCDSLEEVFEGIAKDGRDTVILPNYTSMLAMREILKTKCGGKEFWE